MIHRYKQNDKIFQRVLTKKTGSTIYISYTFLRNSGKKILSKCYTSSTAVMNGSGSGGLGGVTLETGTSGFVGDTLTLVSGSRTWRLRVPPKAESADNVMILEVKQGTTWYPAQQFVVTED
ncbi:unnamed protein product [Ectocarpus sp. 12 AP-2014]